MWRLLLASFCLGHALGAVNWVSKAQVSNYSGYFSKVIQELVYDLEKMEWCNLKMQEYSLNINEMLYQWKVTGTAKYTNGFVVSIEELDITEIEEAIMNRMINGVATPFASISGLLNMRNVKIGFDVEVNLIDPDPPHAPQQRYTGHYTHGLIELKIDIMRNLMTKEMSTSPYLLGVSRDESSTRMIYMPANNVTEVLSRAFMSYYNADSVSLWCKEIIGPKLLNILTTNRVEYPEICFYDCPK